METGCGDASKTPIILDLSGGNGSGGGGIEGIDAGLNGGQSGMPVAGIDVSGAGGSAGTGATGGTIRTGGAGGGGGTGGSPPLSGSGGGGAGGVGGITVDSGSGGAPACFDAGIDPNRNRVQPGNICDRLTTIQCAAEACCCDAPGRDFSTCKEVMLQACRESLRIDAISSDPATGFDEVFAERVFGEYENMAAQCDTNVVSWGTSVDGLRGIIKGTRNANEPCPPAGDLGKTLDEVAAVALASCRDPANSACSHPAVLLWTCLPRVDVNLGCITDLNCKEGLYCNNPDLLLIGGICAPRKTEGSPCTLPNECQTLICKGGQCAPVNKQNVYCLGN